MLVTSSKGHVWEPLSQCQHLAFCGVDTYSAGGDMYFICHVTQQDLSVEMTCVFMGDSSSPHVTTLKSLVTIGILIVMRKRLHQKHLINTYDTEKLSWLDNHHVRKKRHKHRSGIFWEVPRNKKKTFFPLWLPSITLLLKWKPVELKRF